MKLFTRSIIIALVSALVASAHASAAETSFQKAVAAIRASFEKDKLFPLDPALYADEIFVSHNYDTGRTVDSKTYVAGVTKEVAGAAATAGSMHKELTRFLVADDTVVATVLSTGTRPNGDPMRLNITWILKITNGRISALETWLDRKSMEAPAAAPAKP